LWGRFATSKQRTRVDKGTTRTQQTRSADLQQTCCCCATDITEKQTMWCCSTQALREMKHQHESLHGQKPFKVNEAFLYKLEVEMQAYWSALQHANGCLHFAPQFAVTLNVGTNAVDQFTEASKAVSRLAEILGSFAKTDSVLNEEVRSHLLTLVVCRIGNICINCLLQKFNGFEPKLPRKRLL
jgi:hypothetical protein